MAKRTTMDLPDAAEAVTLIVAIWTDAKGRSQLTIEHRDGRIPFPLAREALVTAIALIEPDEDPRFKANPRQVVEGSRGLQYLDTDETRKKPS